MTQPTPDAVTDPDLIGRLREAYDLLEDASPHFKVNVARRKIFAVVEALTASKPVDGSVVERLREQWMGEVYLDLGEARNPGNDEFAQGFNLGLNKARDVIYTRLPTLLEALASSTGGDNA